MGANIPGFNRLCFQLLATFSSIARRLWLLRNLKDLPAQSSKKLIGVGFCVREFIGMSMHVVLCNSKKKVVRVVPWKNTCLGVTSATTWSVSSPPFISVVAKHSWTRTVLEYMTGSVPCLLAFLGVDT